jgi:DNA-binding response OmpR family regulator
MPTPAFVGCARLITSEPDVQPREYVLETDVCTIGRSLDCDIVVMRPFVSRLHARIERQGSHYVLLDLSRNQTYVNKLPLSEPHILRDGEEIGLALPEPLLLFQDSDPTAEPRSRRLRYDEKRMAFSLDGQWLLLRPQGLRLLCYLYQNMGQVCSSEDCVRAIWGDDYSLETMFGNLNKIVHGLRREFRRLDPHCDLIENRHGVGYVLRY